MARAVRTLPIGLDPVTGEALDSWLEALCRQLGCAWGDFIAAVGLPPPSAGLCTPPWLIRLTAAQAGALHAATGVPIPRLHAMTLASLDGTALGLLPATRALDRSFPWSRFRFSRYCPACLQGNGGRWPLFWRTGWAFACTEHCCLLADECPACRRRLRGHVGLVERVPSDGQRCALPATHATGRNSPRCGADLAAAVTVALGRHHRAVTAQHLIRDVIDSGAATFGIYHSHTTTAVEALADIRAVAGRILAYATADDWRRVLPADLSTAYLAAQQRQRSAASSARSTPKPGLAAPSQAVTAAAGITAALAILGSADIDSAGRAMQWLITTSRDHGCTVDHATVASWGTGTTAALTAAQLIACGPHPFRNFELRYRAGTPMPARPAHDTTSTAMLAAKIPALMWPAFALRLTPPRWNFQHMSAGLAAALLLVNSRVSFDEAISMLGRPLGTQALSHVLKRLHADPSWNHIRRALIALADHLHTHDCPIDYQRRRALDYTALLPAATWRKICTRARIVRSHTSLHLTQSHLYAVLTGNPIRRAPGYLHNHVFAAAVPAYPARLNPVAAHALHTVAQEFLHDAGIVEPLTWQPQPRLLDGLVLPGADPDTVDIPALHHLIEQREPLHTVARQLNSTPQAIRYVLTLHPAHPGRPRQTQR
jgi:TniQ